MSSTAVRPEKSRGPIGWVSRLPARWVTIALLLIVPSTLYVLSAGPAVWLNERGRISQQTWKLLVTLYEPMNGIAGAYRPIGAAWSWYLELWSLPVPIKQLAPPPNPPADSG